MQTSFDAADHAWMARALRLAARGLYTTRANPRVGCVLVKNGALVGEGYHRRPGEPHAEIHALRSAGTDARDATAYVTLEPCCHHGRTPPCTDALLEAGVARVVAAMRNPNPQVAGGGLRALSAGGVATACGLHEASARALNIGFVLRNTRGRPFVRLKLAASLDGRTALGNGDSRWVSGAPARADVQRWRARASAIMTGVGTVLSDDPSLTVRINSRDQPASASDTDIEQPLRVVVDSSARTPADARLLGLPGTTLIASTEAAPRQAIERLQAAGAETLVLPRDEHGGVDLAALLQALGARSVNEVHTECGAGLAAGLWRGGLVDELLVYLAPHLMGVGAKGLADLGPFTDMSSRVELDFQDVQRVGNDLRVLARPR